MSHVIERTPICDVRDDHAMCSTVVAACDGAEALLAGRVPQLQPDVLVSDAHAAYLEVDADRADVVLGELVVCKAQQQARLAHTTVANEQQLEEMVVVEATGRHCGHRHGFLEGAT